MRKIPLIAGALALFTLLTAGGVSAFFTDRVSLEAHLSVVAGKDSELSDTVFDESKAKNVLPGAEIEMRPQVKNSGSEDRYVFAEIQVPTVVAGGVASPVFSYEPGDGWTRLQTVREGGRQTEIFYYGKNGLEPLAPGATTPPVIGSVKLLNPAGDSSLAGENAQVGVKMYTAGVKEVSEKTKDVTPANVWGLVSAGAKNGESFVDAVSMDRNITIGSFGVKVETEDDKGALNGAGQDKNPGNTGESGNTGNAGNTGNSGNTGTGANTGTGTGAGTGGNSGTGTGNGTGAGTGGNSGTGTGNGTGAGTGGNSGTGTGNGTGAGTNGNSGTGTGTGAGTGGNSGVGTGTGTGAGTGAGNNDSTDTGSGNSGNTGNANTDSGSNSGTDSGSNSGTNSGSNSGTDSGSNTGTDSNPDEDANLVDKEVDVENTGSVDTIMFIKVTPAFDGSEGEVYIVDPNMGIVDLGRDGNDYVFGVNRALKENEKLEDIFAAIKADCPVASTAIISIQAANLKDTNGDIDTSGNISKEDLDRIYRLYTSGDNDYFKDEKEIGSISPTSDILEIIENFPTPAGLKVGRNDFVKEVRVKNTADEPEYIRVYLGYTDKRVRDNSYLSWDGGKNYYKVDEFKDHLPPGWIYKVEKGVGYFYQAIPVNPGKITTSLFTNVRTDFSSEKEVRDFDIIVYAQSSKGGWNEIL